MLERIRIVSNNICYGPAPAHNEEVEQHLTINREGRVWLTRLSFLDGIIEKKLFAIDKDDAEDLFEIFEERLSGDVSIIFATDVGSWDMRLTYEVGREVVFSGPLVEREPEDMMGFSCLIRDMLGRADLFVLDGNPDRVDEVVVKYQRKQGNSEELRIDRAKETLTYVKQTAEHGKQTNVYEAEGRISTLLDVLYPEIFDDMPEVPDDVMDDPNEERIYKLELLTKHGKKKSYSGFYDKFGLPYDWSDFIEKVHEFMTSCGDGELFDKAYYRSPRRRTGDYIFCDVIFGPGSKKYCYIADDDSYEVGDTVIVPTGDEYSETVGKIVGKNYYAAEDAPFPVNKAKHIIRKADEKEG